MGAESQRYMRRLSDKVVAAFDQACDIGEVEIAESLSHVLELVLTMEGRKSLDSQYDRRKNFEVVAAAFERVSEMKRIK